MLTCHFTNPGRKLQAALEPQALNVVNESGKHAGHVGNPTGAPDAETHFRWEEGGEQRVDESACSS